MRMWTCRWCGAPVMRRGAVPTFCSKAEAVRFYRARRRPLHLTRDAVLALAAAVVERARADLIAPGAAGLDPWCHAPDCAAERRHRAARAGCHPAQTCARAWLDRLERLPREADVLELAMEVLAP